VPDKTVLDVLSLTPHAREVVGSGAAVKESNRNTDTTTESTTYKKQLTTLIKLLTVDMNLGEEAVG
jgi:hypothetical protein